MNKDKQLTVLFDGVCNLCSFTVLFIIRRDPKAKFMFASLQSDVGQSILRDFQHPSVHFDSILLIADGLMYTKSTAALQLIRRLNGLWPLLYMFIIIPKPIRDALYTYIARNRYKWFGQKDACMIPTPEIKSRFL